MKGSRILLVALLILSSVGCVQSPPRPDSPVFAPVAPAAMQAPKANDGAIYQAGYSLSLYEDRRARRVGDILTVVLTERTTASKESATDVEKKSNIDIAQPTLFGKALSIAGNPLSASLSGGTRTFDSKGDADQSNSLNGSITVSVSEVLPNGVLRVRGEKWMTLNRGDEYIRLSGLVRTDDIGTDNSVLSTRLADARITYSGTGEVHDANAMGWITRFFINPIWPF